MKICITGMPGAGKSEVATILRRRGFRIYEMREVVDEMMRNEGIEITIENREKFTPRIRKERGNEIVAVELEKRVVRHNYKDIVISGLRSMYEFRYLKKYMKGLIIIAVIAPSSMRFERLKHRNKERVMSYRTFEERERTNKGFGMEEAIKHADFLIYNEGTKAELKRSVDEIVSRLEQKNVD